MNTFANSSYMPPKQVINDGADQPMPPEWAENELPRLERRLLRYLTRRTGNPDAASDIVQEALLRFIQMPEDRRLRDPASYLFTIALNVAKEKNGQESGVVDFDSSVVEGPGLEVEHDALSAYDSLRIEETLETAVAGMPPIQRKVLLMSKVEGFSHKEISEKLGRKIGTIKKLAARALRRAREALANVDLD